MWLVGPLTSYVGFIRHHLSLSISKHETLGFSHIPHQVRFIITLTEGDFDGPSQPHFEGQWEIIMEDRPEEMQTEPSKTDLASTLGINKLYFCKSQMVYFMYGGPHDFCHCIQLCNYNTKSANHNMLANVPIKLYLPKQATSWIWSMTMRLTHSITTPQTNSLP